MLLSLPVLSRVVMASVAMLRFESVTRFSRSRLQAVTADGCFMATYFGRKDKENKDKRFKKKIGLVIPLDGFGLVRVPLDELISPSGRK